MKHTAKFLCCTAGMLLASITMHLQAGDMITTGKDSTATASSDTRYGFLNLLDHRSAYGQGVFPEPFLVDDSDLETNEFRLDWLHTRSPDTTGNAMTAEFEKGFGLLTLELGVHYETNKVAGVHEQGFDNFDVGVRYPLYQYVSPGGVIDSTFGAGLEIGVPVNTAFSKNMELVPKIFNDLKIGDHFTVQSLFGYSALVGPQPDGGTHTFEYGFILGYNIPHKDLPIPGVQKLVPMFEISGQRGLNNGSAGDNNITADVGFRVRTNAIGRIQPRLGVAFVFPMDRNARADSHWGIATSLVFEY